MVQVLQSANYYREKVHEQTHNLKLLLTELRNELPSSGPLKFAAANIELIEIVSKFFIKEIQLSANDEDRIKCCKKYLKFLQDITENVIPFLEGINEAFIPSEFLLTLAHQTKELAKKLRFSEEFYLCLCPRWDFNYGIYAYKDFILSSLDDLPGPLFPELLKDFQRSPQMFVFINYPRTESRNILLHSIMIHELGHLVDFQTGISKTVFDDLRIDRNSFNTLFKKERKREKTKPEDVRMNEAELVQKLFDDCLKITEKWLKEFVSDLVAIHLLGPAYFFALYEMSILTDDMHKYSEGHPSSGIRLRVISEELHRMYLKNNNKLKHEGTRKLISKIHQDLKESEKKKEFEPTGEAVDYFKVAYLTILPNRLLLQKSVRQKIKGFSYDVKRFNNEVELLFKDLKKGVPPCKFPSDGANKNKAASFTSILNAGWLAYFFGMDDFYSLVSATNDSDKLRALDNFNQLLFKAVESGHILQEWLKE